MGFDLSIKHIKWCLIGIIWDFAGPYAIGKGRMAFGSPTRYMRLDPVLAREKGKFYPVVYYKIDTIKTILKYSYLFILLFLPLCIVRMGSSSASW